MGIIYLDMLKNLIFLQLEEEVVVAFQQDNALPHFRFFVQAALN
jgi:hypothetical protein